MSEVPKLFHGIYRGLVESNDDPLKLGRVRVRVYPMMYGFNADHLPWAPQASPMVSGAGDGCGWFAVPSVGSYVFVFFEGGDIYSPVVMAEAPDGVHGQVESAKSGYPSRKVIRTKSGTEVSLDDESSLISLSQPGGTRIVMGTDGSVEIWRNGVKTVTLPVAGGITLHGDTSVEGDVEIEGDLAVGGDASVAGDMTVGGSVVSDELSAESLALSGDLSVGREMSVAANAAIGGHLSVQGNVAAGGLSVGGNAAVQGIITMGGLVVSVEGHTHD